MASSSAAVSTSTRMHDDQVDKVIKSSALHHELWIAFLSQAESSEGNQQWTTFFKSVFSTLSATLRQVGRNVVGDHEQASIVENFSDVERAKCKDLMVGAMRQNEWRPLVEYVDEKLRRIGDKIVKPRLSEGGLQSAFEEPYRGTTHSLFINTLKSYWGSSRGSDSSGKPYNWSISVIQSSGMGKSRMVEQAARSIFTIPINIREDIGSLFRTYPPPDEAFRQYFESHQSKTDHRLQAEYAIILALLFEHATKLLGSPTFNKNNKKKKTGAGLALEWTDYLNKGRTDAEVGINRKNFLDSVAAEAVELRASMLDTAQGGAHGSPIDRMKVSCSRFVEALPGEAGELKCIVYLDEVHRLTEPVSPDQQNGTRTRSPYHNLGTVLAELTDCAVFFVFLSTSSHLQKLAPSPASHPSVRVAQGRRLFPPFTELPFDVFENEVLQNLRGQGKKLSLENMCQPSIMVGFGRSLWYVHHKNWVERKGRPVIPFAGEKLNAQGDNTRVFHSQVAALGVRIGITFDMTTQASRVMAAELVESHMRVVYATPQHREFMHSGTPSEPVLAEAAALYLNDSGGIETRGPEVLAQACGKGLLAKGERGELCGRLLVTIAHDLALTQKYSPKATYDPNVTRFHQPVPVLEFLQALFAEPFHKTILDAHSVTARDGVLRLGEAFAESYICFSHFALAKNTEMLTAPNLAVALRRGMALQAKDNQDSIDAVIPVHMGPTSTTILPGSTSAINLQFKNRKQAVACHVDRSITVPNISMPVISIIFEFGEESAATDSLVTIDTKATRRRTRSSVGKMLPDDHHYTITAYGCTSKTFKAVSPDVENHYPSILAARSILEDFPRAKSKENLEALEDLKPYFDGVLELENRSEEWENLKSELATRRKRPRRSTEPAVTPAAKKRQPKEPANTIRVTRSVAKNQVTGKGVSRASGSSTA